MKRPSRTGHAVRRGSGEDRERVRQGLILFVEGLAGLAGEAPPSRRAAAKTAARVGTAWTKDLMRGYRQDPVRVLRPIAARSSEGLVVARDIEFASICRHHLMPFSGRVHLGYAPAGRITGLSRLGRLVDCLSRRLQLQEGMTAEIARAIQQALSPEGAGCVVEASHTCVTMRGTRRTGTRIVTTSFTGVFAASAARRRELLGLLVPQSGRPVKVSR